jgi:hypothetical protein
VKSAPRPKNANTSVIVRPPGRSIAEGCRLIGIARSTFYEKPAAQDDTAIVEAIAANCKEFEFHAGGAFAPSFGIGA